MTSSQSPEPTGEGREARLLPQYVQAWERQGIITPEQGEAILAYHHTARRPRLAALLYSRLVVILATFGAILVGAGVILFVGSNWQEITRWQKLVLILGTTGVTYAAGYWLQEQRGYPRIGQALLLLATLFYGAGIFLVAQLYHFNANNPYLHTAWFIGVFPLAYLLRSRAILTLALLLGLFDLGFYLAARLDIWPDEGAFFTLYLTTGVALYALALLQARSARTAFYGPPYLLFGALTVFLFLYLLAFEDISREVSLTSQDLPWGGLPGWFWGLQGAFTAMAALSVVGVLVAVATARRPWGTFLYEVAAVLVLLGTAYLTLFAPFWQQAWAPTAYWAGFNLLLAALILGVIVAGVVTRRPALVNVGIVFFALDLMTRYIEIARGMLQTSLFFILGGLLLLGIGFVLERVRRRLLARLAPAEVDDGP